MVNKHFKTVGANGNSPGNMSLFFREISIIYSRANCRLRLQEHSHEIHYCFVLNFEHLNLPAPLNNALH